MRFSFECGLIALSLALAAIEAGAIGASALGLTITRPLAWLIVAGAALAAWAGARHGARNEPAGAEQPGPRPVTAWVMACSTALLVAFYLSLWVVAGCLPDLTCDGNTYHIPAIHHWACAGRITWVNLTGCRDLPYLNGYPKGVETVDFVVAVALGSSRWINAVNLLFLPLGVLGLATCCRTLGVSNQLSLLAGCTWIGVPVNLFQSNTTYCDSAFASCVVGCLALTLLLVCAATREGRIPWSGAIPWGAALGLVLAAKGSGVIAATAVTVALGGVLLATRRGAALRLLVPGLLVAFLCGGFWSVRNWVMTGSPLYPVGLSLFGHTIFPGQSVATSIDALRNTPAEIRGAPWPWQVAQAWLQSLPNGWPASIASVDSHLGGLGFLWLAGCVPALAWLANACRRAPAADRELTEEHRLALLFLATVVMLMFLGTPMRWWARYTCWIYVAGIPPLAWLVQRNLARHASHGGLGRLWPIALLTLMLCETLLGWMLLVAQISAFRRMSAGCRTLSERALVAMFPEARDTELGALCATREPLAFGPLAGQSPTAGSFRSALPGPFCLPIGTRRICGVDQEMSRLDAVRLVQAGVRRLIWNRTVPLPPGLREVAIQVEPVGGFLIVHLAENLPPSATSPQRADAP